MNSNIDIAKLMNMLSKMDKKELENSLNQVSEILNSRDAENIINQIKKQKN